jgi:hypothetical protein
VVLLLVTGHYKLIAVAKTVTTKMRMNKSLHYALNTAAELAATEFRTSSTPDAAGLSAA